MELHNLLEEEVLHIINEIIEKDSSLFCVCEKCKLDIAAIALNSLPPQYTVTESGYLYAKAENLTSQFNVSVLTAISKAIEIVSSNPKHK